MTSSDRPARAGSTKFTQRREATRRELLRLGLERFPVKGYSSTTIDDIVRDSGLTRGAFYFHFAGKEEFFLELLRLRAELRDEWWLVARDPGHADTRAAVAATLAHLGSVPDGGAWLLLIADFFQAAQAREEHTIPLRALYAQWIVELAAFVAELRARGLARTDLAPEALGAEIFAVAEGYTIHRVLYEVPNDGLLDALVRILRP
jgi:AcrR family transcriptional regulator